MPRSLAGSNFVGISKFVLRREFQKFDLKKAKESTLRFRNVIDTAQNFLCKLPGAVNSNASFVTLPMGKQSVDVEMVTGDGNPYAYVLWIHGGAHVIGTAKTYRTISTHVSVQADVTCFVPEFRLAPEHSFPASLDDNLSVYEHLIGEFKIPPHKLCIAGDSSGGAVALTLLSKIHEKKLPKPQALILNSPWLDLRFRGGSWETAMDLVRGEDVDVMISYCAKSYAGNINMRDPRLSPFYLTSETLQSILPDYVMLQAGDEELLYDSIQKFHQKLEKVENIKYTYNLLEGGWHVPLFAPMTYEGKQQYQEIKRFIQQAF